MLLLVVLALPALSSCQRRVSTPVVAVGAANTLEEVVVREWQVVGSFPVPTATQEGTAVLSETNFDHDYFRASAHTEADIDAQTLPEIRKSLLNRQGLPRDFQNSIRSFADGVVRFDKVFQTKQNAVAYAACEIDSPEETEVVLVTGADDAHKLWLNGQLLLRHFPDDPGARVRYGSLGRNDHFTLARLRKGRNFLLVKVYQGDRMWGFNLSLASLEVARSKSRARELYLHDVAERSILAKGDALRLHTELRLLLQNLKLDGQVEVLNPDKETVSTTTLDAALDRGVSLDALKEGLYYVKVSCPLYSFEEPFSYGASETLWASFEERYRRLQRLDEKTVIDFEALSTRRAHLSRPANLQPGEKLWQRKIVRLLHESEFILTRLEQGREAVRHAAGTHLRGFKSKVDGQLRHYMVHFPAHLAAERTRVPLVVVVPYPVPNPKPFLESVHVANVNLVGTVAKLADRHGYAVLWPSGRENAEGTPLMETDIFETLEAVRADYPIDDDRLYLTGTSLGGTYALQLGAHYPDLFAAVGVVMPQSDLVAIEKAAVNIHSPYPLSWINLNSPLSLAENLRNTPLYIVHGDEDRVVPAEQSTRFVQHCQRLGFAPRLDILPHMDHVYAAHDPNPLLFEFFKDRVRQPKPASVSLVTGQLKYSSAHWLKLTRLDAPTQLARLHATQTSAAAIEVEANNAGQYEISLDALRHESGQPLTISTNGKPSFQGVPRERTLRIDIDRAAAQQPEIRFKNARIEGPVMHAFAAPFLVVEGASGSPERARHNERLGREICDAWKEDYFVDCPRKKDHEVNQDDISEKNLILLGDAETNQLINRMSADLPLRISADHITLGDKIFQGTGLNVVSVHPNPLNGERYVVFIGSNDPANFRFIDSHLWVRGWYDYVVWNSRAAQTSELHDVGYWNRFWQRVEPSADMAEARRALFSRQK